MITIKTEPHLEQINMPENLAIGLMIAEKRKECATLGIDFTYYSFALGQSPFPVPESIQKELEHHADKVEYAEAAGIEPLRRSIAEFNKRHFDMDVRPENIIIGPGTKSLLFLLFSILEGTFVVPVPSWIGYTPLLTFAKKEYRTLELDASENYRLNPEKLDAMFADIEGTAILVLNHPNNPSGVVYSKKELQDITDVCRKHNALVISDEIYALTTYEFENFVSMGNVFPEGTFITNGLSKDRSAGGYRFGTCLLPEQGTTKLRDTFKKIAASIFSNVSTPIQYAAIKAYAENNEISTYFTIIRSIHRIMGHHLSEAFSTVPGLSASMPEGGFYFLLDFNTFAEKLKANGITDANQLSKELLKDPYDVALVAGKAIITDPDNFLARIAFIDYDGAEVYQAYLDNPPANTQEEVIFFNQHGKQMLDGVEQVKRFLDDLK